MSNEQEPEGHEISEWAGMSWSEESIPVGTVPDETLAIDSVEDVVRQRIKDGLSVADYVRQCADTLAESKACRMLNRVFCMILEARKPKMIVHQLQWLAGMCEESGPALARHHGVSKQAFVQGAAKIAAELGMRKTRTMRTEESKAKMSDRNHRNEKV